ncbi:hypothetical protein N8199_08755 [Emcibacteraceae bacterium]|nr:hypothetical protein [Emcibacteraceae bacterium]
MSIYSLIIKNPVIDEFNLKYRPKSYWGPKDLKMHFGTTIKGEIRRQLVTSSVEKENIPAGVLQSELDDNVKKHQGSIHPSMMGGEYLPDFETTEIEIARVILKSVTMDVYSIRAIKNNGFINYRVVDEYETTYILKPIKSVHPLSFKEIIQLLDTARREDGEGGKGGLIDSARDYFYSEGMTAKEVYDFGTAKSEFYPELTRWYDEINKEWLKQVLIMEKEDEEDDYIS